MATCVICGQQFQAKRAGHKICSDECRKQARGWDYRQARAQAIYRDGFRCQQCHAEGRLECHHIKPVSEGGDHRLSNLKTLCHGCHVQEHRRMRAEARRAAEEAISGLTGRGGSRRDRAA